MVHSIEL